jgi:hypothetical protein
MEEIKENNNELNQEPNPKKEWIKPDLEIIDIEGGFTEIVRIPSGSHSPV